MFRTALVPLALVLTIVLTTVASAAPLVDVSVVHRCAAHAVAFTRAGGVPDVEFPALPRPECAAITVAVAPALELEPPAVTPEFFAARSIRSILAPALGAALPPTTRRAPVVQESTR